MSNIQFDFNPLTPNPGGGGSFPWGSILIGLGLFAIIYVIVYNLSQPEVGELPIPKDDNNNQEKTNNTP